MVRTLLIWGIVVGIVVGLLAFGFAKAFREPQVDRAIAFEEQMDRAKGEAPGPELVSRAVQSGVGSTGTKWQPVPINQGRLYLRSICFAQSIFIAGFIRLAFLEIDTAHGQQPSLPPVSDRLSGDEITGTWGGLRSKLTDRGFEFVGSYDAGGRVSITF
jgi:hypothetical protein